MGREAVCQVEHSGGSFKCRLHLDSDSLTFSGGLKRVISLGSIAQVQAAESGLQIRTAEECYLLDLGEKDSKAWANAILNPPTLLSKLGVKDGMRILTVGFADLSFLGSVPSVQENEPGDQFDLVFVLAETLDGLAELERLSGLLLPEGAIWTVSPKGKKAIAEVDVIMRGRAGGLVDTKVCRFSETHTGNRFVAKKG